MASAAAAAGDWSPSRSAAGPYSPWLLVGIISIPTFMEVLSSDSLIVPQIRTSFLIETLDCGFDGGIEFLD